MTDIKTQNTQNPATGNAVFVQNQTVSKDAPEWLKAADSAVQGKISGSVVNIRADKPTKAELGEDPSSVVSFADKKVEVSKTREVAKSQESAKVEMKTSEQEKKDSAVPNKTSVLSKLKSLFDFSGKNKVQDVVKKDEKTVVVDKSTRKETKLTEAERKEYIEAEKIYQEGLIAIKDLIAPSSMEIQYDAVRLDGLYAISFYVYSYPRYLDVNWLSPVINFDVTMDISQFIYPIGSDKIMNTLKKKVAQMQSSMRILSEKGMVRDPALETAL